MNINPGIKCKVNSCKYNNVEQKYCTLDVIQVGTHESHPSQMECTDCESFELK